MARCCFRGAIQAVLVGPILWAQSGSDQNLAQQPSPSTVEKTAPIPASAGETKPASK